MGGTLVSYDFKGLVTAPGLLARAEASAVLATNILFDAPGVARKRRGQQRLAAGTTGGGYWKLHSSAALGANLIWHNGSGTSATVLRIGDGVSAGTGITTVDGSNVTRPPQTRSKMALSGRNHYLTSDEGVRRIQSNFASDFTRYAGMPRGSLQVSSFPISATGPLLNGFARAYRVTWHRLDADGVELGGAPTGRCVARNNSGSQANASVRISVPKEFGTTNTNLTTSYFYRLWATRSFQLSVSLPNDELYLVAEAFLTGTDITNTFATATDTVPDTFLLASPRLHTNAVNYPPGEAGIRNGVVNADEPPPIAADVCQFAGCTWFGNLSYRHRLTATLLSTGGASGLQNGDTITVGGQTYRAQTSPTLSTDFPVFTGFATVTENIEATMQGFCEAVNRLAANTTVYAYYLSQANQLAGFLYIEHRSAATGFTFACSRSGVFRPEPTLTSSNDARTNALAFSKPGRADAVPTVNIFSVGPADATILRIFPLRERLYVFTTQGIYVVTGDSFLNFSLDAFDLTCRLLVPESVCVCDDRLYGWAFEGIFELDDGGVRYISPPIEPTVEELTRVVGETALATAGYGVGYRKAHRVQFHYPTQFVLGANVACSDWLSFDTRTRAWSTGRLTYRPATYTDARSCGVVRFSDDLLVQGSYAASGDGFLFLERRAYTAADYVDTAIDGTDTVVSASLALQYQVVDAASRQHWQQAVVHFEGAEVSWRPPPTSVSVIMGTEEFTSTVVVALDGAQLVTRIEVPQTARRGTYLRTTITSGEQRHMGIVGAAMRLADSSSFARRT